MQRTGATSIILKLIAANLMVISHLQGREAHNSLTPNWLNGHSSYVDENTK